jgi:hypothetical protein
MNLLGRAVAHTDSHGPSDWWDAAASGATAVIVVGNGTGYRITSTSQ